MAAGVTVAADLQPCVKCGVPTKVRVWGVPGTWGCIGGQPAPTNGPKLRFLEELHDNYAPRGRMAQGGYGAPYWQPKMPDVTDRVFTSTWASWQIPSVPSAEVLAVLDRTAAYLSSTASVEVAHGDLVHTPDETRYNGAPGLYKVMWHPWEEAGLPHPLGAGEFQDDQEHEMWVTHPRVQLLQRLADQGRYPDGFIVDAYTGRRTEDGKPRTVRLDKWAKHVQSVREAIIHRYGRDSAEYEAQKTNFSQARTMMVGTKNAGQSRTWDKTCRIRRPDWGWAISEQSAVTLWSWADDINQVVTRHGHPEYGVVGLRSVDEIVVPLEGLKIAAVERRSATRGPVPIDQAGIKLGTFKVKAIEE